MPLYTLEGISAQAAATGLPVSVITDLYKIIDVSIIYVAACLSFTIWDALVSFPHEWQPIWKARWSLVKVIYIASRVCIIYANAWCMSVAALETAPDGHSYLWTGSFTAAECNRLYRSQAVVYVPNELFATALLFLRVWAVSRRSKIVGAIFAFLLTVQTVCDIVIAIAGLKPIPTFSLDGKQWCIAGGGPMHNFATAFWAFPIANVIISTGIMIFYVRRLNMSTTSGLVKTVVNEGIIYQLYGLKYQVRRDSPAKSDTFSAPASISITTLMACRLVLSLHRNTLNSPGATKRTGKDSFWQGRSAVMEPISRPAPSANSFKLHAGPTEGSVHSNFPHDDKARTDDLADPRSDAPFAVNLYPAGQVRVQLDRHVYAESSSVHGV